MPSIQGKARRRKPTPAEVAAIRRMIESSCDNVWFRRWHAAIPHAVRAYADAVRKSAEVAIDKYSQSLQRFAVKRQQNAGRRPGA